jgi:hypothetical protein
VGCELPRLTWGKSAATARLDDGYHSAAHRKANKGKPRPGNGKRLTRAERLGTPIPFRDMLIAMAKSVTREEIVDDL